MKRYRRTAAILTGITLCMSIIAGCTGEGNEASVSASPTNSASPVATGITKTPQSNDRTKFDPPVTISAAITLRPSDKLRFGDTPENNPVTRWLSENLGIVTKFRWVVTDTAAFETKVRLAMASGETLPDVLYTGGSLLEELIDSGKIQTIDEAYEKYASPRLKNLYEKNPAVWATAKRNGKVIGLPDVSNGVVGENIMWIRQDWLDKLQMKAPTNIEEFEKLLDAFTNQDPDGNGKKDTFGMAFGANTGYHKPTNNYMTNTEFIFGQDQPYMWLKGPDGQLQYGANRPTVKAGLAKLNQWFSKGYFNPDFGTMDAAKAMADFTSGKAGIAIAAGWAGAWPIGTAVSEAKSKNQTLNVKPYPIPSGITGEVGRQESQPSYGTYVFRKGFDNMEAIFKYYDTMYGCLIEDPKCPFAVGQGEGYDYVMKDGKPDWKTVPDGIVNLSRYLIFPSNGTAPTNVMEGPSIYQRVAAGKLDNVFEQKLAASNDKLAIDGFSVGYLQMDKDVKNGFYGANTPTMKEKWEQLNALEDQAYLQIIYGKQKPDYFDTFLKQWHEQGGTQITKEINESVAKQK
ncbi:extracellular solute-binding protein [Paenibacillus sp. HWE-109]|uniref:extracellular solute-binding protein n=1 Tax=Paenibacillus sp. HWE-109 TaxID=1306526 RepID=UPI001EE11D95|nr:extracellular solute-binding protein [Paenibacillus sp. HWE-109]UKS27650.1 extracellular solute-binding protein [Paenibacillus sp. HWE-109]